MWQAFLWLYTAVLPMLGGAVQPGPCQALFGVPPAKTKATSKGGLLFWLRGQDLHKLLQYRDMSDWL